jgi:L-lactate dehydrogenase complex protein LldG
MVGGTRCKAKQGEPLMAMPSRQTILDCIRAATRNDSNIYADLPRNYVHRGALDNTSRIQLMAERLHEYGAEVVETPSADLPATIARQLQSSGRRTFVAPPSISADWLASDIDWKLDNNLPYDEIERCDGVLTGSFAGVADSGTIVLHHLPREGRRVITLLPDFHLCVLRASDIVETLPEYFARCPAAPRLATYISGPSATADIEMTRIKGVHGPRFLSVILVCDDL